MNYIHTPKNRPLNVAVIGTGIAGMSAAWLLNQKHKVTVYEINDRIGGHSNTVDAETSAGTTPVDTGFIVYNEKNYPNLTALFKHLDVPTKDSEMSFSASLENGGFEYAGTDLNGLFGQRANLVRPRFWRMMSDLLRFYKSAPMFLNEPENDQLSLGDYLKRESYSAEFLTDHLLPIGAAIWSTTPAEMMNYPAKAFIRFFESHGLLLIQNRPQWRTVDGGSRQYVKRLIAGFEDKIRFGGVRSVKRAEGYVQIEDRCGDVGTYDHVVIATHADEALALLVDPDGQEKDVLGAWRYSKNRAVLHTDAKLMPKRKRVWSSWNFIEGEKGDETQSLCVTYWMNRLQSLDPGNPLFLTLNPNLQPAFGKTLREFEYTHPFFDASALQSQQHLWNLQGNRRTWYCGSYFGYGFHEDALQAGLAVAEQLGELKRPWQVDNESGRIHITSGPQVSAA